MKQTNPVFHRQQAAVLRYSRSPAEECRSFRFACAIILGLRLFRYRERLFYRQSYLPECLRSLRLFE